MGDLIDDVRNAAGALGALVPHAASFGQPVVESLQKTTAAVEPELAKSEIVLAVAGDSTGRRSLLRAVLGEAIEGHKARRERIIRIASRGPYEYIARRDDGTALRFTRSMPDRDPLYRRQIDDAEEKVRAAQRAREELVARVEGARAEVRATEEGIAAMEAEAETLGETFADAWRAHKAAEARVVAIDRAEPEVPPIFRTSPPWWALWVWMMRWMMQSKWREPLALRAQNRAEAVAAREREKELGTAAKSAEDARETLKARRDAEAERLTRAHADLAAVEVALAEERAAAEAEGRLDALLRDRAKYAGERKDEFFADLHDFDATARGDDIGDIDVELPPDHPNAPPPGVVLAIGPDAWKSADGYVVVKDGTGRDDLRGTLPRAASLSSREDVTKALAPVAAAKARVVAAKLAMRLRFCIAEVEVARGHNEGVHAKRLESLEQQRIPHPDEFRARQIERSEAAIEKAADEVVASALDHFHLELAAIRKDWSSRVEAASGLREVFACIDDVNQRGKLRVLEMLEGVSELVAREMASHGEKIGRSALDEVQASYRTQKRMRAESLAPVASEVTGEDLAKGFETAVPIASARERFRRSRTLRTIGALVAGAIGGSAIHLGVGTGVGAVVGTLAFFVNPTGGLRRDCLAAIDAYASAVTTKVDAVLREKRDDIALGIRMSLDDSLAEALGRINDAITRLMTVEKNAIESERVLLANLASTRGTLEEHDARLREAIRPFTEGESLSMRPNQR